MAPSKIGKIKRCFVRLGVEAMPFIPLPAEWYRKVLVKDSERRYASGRWAYMKDIAEAHRYSIIIGCSDYLKTSDRKILDVGCGEGVLQSRIAYAKYVGIDMNVEAIRLAKSREDENTEFVLADAGTYDPHDMYDVIVFNESLYYIRTPFAVFTRYRKFLADEGIMIVCMFQTNLARKLWKKIQETDIVELTTAKISNDLGFASVVKVYANTPFAPRP